MKAPQFKKTVLSNGIRVLSEFHDSTRCVEVGFWIDRGTRDEDKNIQGIAHLLEHLVFKGTENLSTLEIAQKIEAVGGEVNAFTTKEHTCYHTSTLAEDFELSMEVLSELFCKATIDESEFDKEKAVVIQEILMAKDDIEDRVFDSYFDKAFSPHPLGWTILGSEESIESMKRQQVYDWYKDTYCAENLIISVAGNIHHDMVVSLAEKHLGHLKNSKHLEKRKAPTWKSWRTIDSQENCEQVHVILGFPGVSYADPGRFDAFILNTYLGGGMTSKLYQKIREEEGWAYSVFSMLNTYTDCGSHILYAATDTSLYKNVAEAFLSELKTYRQNKISAKDLDFYRKQAKGQILISSEDIESRMNSLAINEMVFGQYRPVDSVIEELEKTTLDSVNAYMEKWFEPSNMQLFIFGDIDPGEKIWLKGLTI